MQVSAPQGIKIYNISAGKSLEDWIVENRNRPKFEKLKSHDSMLLFIVEVFWKVTYYSNIGSRLDLIQDLHFKISATHIKITPDNSHLVAAGIQ